MRPSEIERIRGRRATLYEGTLALEVSLAAPTGDFDRWRARVCDAATKLRGCIEAHAEESERPGEFLDTVIRDAPHLASAANRLEAEHNDLIARARDLECLLETFGTEDTTDAADTARRSALELMGRLIRHRQRGADLIYLMYNEDLGSSGG